MTTKTTSSTPTTNNQPGLLVEDESVVGGVDATTGAPVIRPKTIAGRADESTLPTDRREKKGDDTPT